MNFARRTAALVLLATFVAGGFVAPVLHEGRHALEQQREAEASLLAHVGHIHGDRARVEGALDAGPEHDLCLLCHLRWSMVVSDGSAPASSADGTHVPIAAQGVLTVALALLSIRGPPAAA